MKKSKHNWENTISNINFLLKRARIQTMQLLGLLSLATIFVSFEDISITDWQVKLQFFFLVIVSSFIISAISIIIKSRACIYKDGNKSLHVSFGNVFTANSVQCNNRIIVIPVNSCFDTELSFGIVSDETLHGQWILKMIEDGFSKQEIDHMIESELACVESKKTSTSNRKKSNGKNTSYPLGTTISVNGNNGTIYFLIAISEFDNCSRAQSDFEQLEYAINRLIDHYDKFGQGYLMCVPLIGTGMSRTGIKPTESLELLKTVFCINKKWLNGNVEIVIYNKFRDMIPLEKIFEN